MPPHFSSFLIPAEECYMQHSCGGKAHILETFKAHGAEAGQHLEIINIVWFIISHPLLEPVYKGTCSHVEPAGLNGSGTATVQACHEITRRQQEAPRPARHLIGLQERCKHLTSRPVSRSLCSALICISCLTKEQKNKKKTQNCTLFRTESDLHWLL